MLPADIDILIDDGSHRLNDQLTTLALLWPSIRKGGWYCIEDIEPKTRHLLYDAMQALDPDILITSDTTTMGYTWTTSNTVWNSPLYCTVIPGGAVPTHNAALTMSYQSTATRYSVYRLAGAAITGGALLEREYSNANYFTVAQQGRFAHFGFSALPDRPYSGHVFLVNLIALMDNY